MVIHGGEANKSGLIHYTNTGNCNQVADKEGKVKPRVSKQNKHQGDGPLSGVCPHDGLYLSGTQNNPVTVSKYYITVIKIPLFKYDLFILLETLGFRSTGC